MKGGNVKNQQVLYNKLKEIEFMENKKYIAKETIIN